MIFSGRGGCWVFGLRPSSGILKNTMFRKLDLFPSSGGRGKSHLLCCVLSKQLTSITGVHETISSDHHRLFRVEDICKHFKCDYYICIYHVFSMFISFQNPGRTDTCFLPIPSDGVDGTREI
jgi:hypothetical protein